MYPFKSWPQRLLELAFAVLVVALMLSWAWALLRPLVPVIVIGVGAVALTAAVISYIRRRWRYW